MGCRSLSRPCCRSAPVPEPPTCAAQNTTCGPARNRSGPRCGATSTTSATSAPADDARQSPDRPVPRPSCPEAPLQRARVRPAARRLRSLTRSSSRLPARPLDRARRLWQISRCHDNDLERSGADTAVVPAAATASATSATSPGTERTGSASARISTGPSMLRPENCTDSHAGRTRRCGMQAWSTCIAASFRPGLPSKNSVLASSLPTGYHGCSSAPLARARPERAVTSAAARSAGTGPTGS